MPRQARQASGTGIYHVMMRGINHQNIFEDEEYNRRSGDGSEVTHELLRDTRDTARGRDLLKLFANITE